MILAIARTGFVNLRRDRAALALTFVLPIVFFTIFAGVFGNAGRQGMPAVRLVIVDQDGSDFSRRLTGALRQERALRVLSDAEALPARSTGPLDSAAAEAAVRAGRARVALIIPKGFGSAPLSFGPSSPSSFSSSSSIQMLHDSSDPIAPQVVAGIVQKASITSMPDALAGEGVKYLDKMSGGLTPEQRQRIDRQLESLRSQVRSAPRPAQPQ
ncbi:MAG: ABC transporter permease, partial [Terriglobales bacterium]